jgi:hypothetical protein
MAHLTNPEGSELRETKALRDRRDLLLRKADQARYRLHWRPELTRELQHATTELLKRELMDSVKPAHCPDPLGDVSRAGPHFQARLPYKDD